MKRISLVLLVLLYLDVSMATAHENHDAPYSMAMSQWEPTREGECSKEIHDSYSLMSPEDGKRYPTWHPPVHVITPAIEATGTDAAVPAETCNFGHEHGANPSNSPLAAWGPIYFGFVNEQAMNAGIHMIHRKEDHAGHKVISGFDIVMNPSGLHGPALPLTCQLLAKLHQGTHSADAFTNNLHEQLIRVSCSDGSAFEIQLLSQIGAGGFVKQQCLTQPVIYVGTPVPADSPTTATSVQRGHSMGHRFLPTDLCAHVERPNLLEIWKTQNGVMGLDGRMKLGAALYWSVANPSRYFDPLQPNKLGRSIDICWMESSPGVYLVISNPCVGLRASVGGSSVAHDDVASPFKGTQRGLRFDSFTLRNGDVADVPVWYTNAFGLNPSLTKTESSYLKQSVTTITHTPNQYSYGNMAGGTAGGKGGGLSGNFDAVGVHTPN